MNNYAIEIEVSEKVFRYSTTPYSEVLEADEGRVPVDFLPHIVEINLGESAISLEGKAAIPSTSVKVWDGKRTLSDFFSAIDYESAEVRVFDLDSNKELVFRGYLTDFSHTSAEASFTVRLDERFHLKEGLWIKFTANTFQHFEVGKPLNIEIATSWLRSGDLDMRIASVDFWVRDDGAWAKMTLPAISSPRAELVEWRGRSAYFFHNLTTEYALDLHVKVHSYCKTPLYGSVVYDDVFLDGAAEDVGGGVIGLSVRGNGPMFPRFNFYSDPVEGVSGIKDEWHHTFDEGNTPGFAAIGHPNSRYYEVIKHSQARFSDHADSGAQFPTDSRISNSKRVMLRFCESFGVDVTTSDIGGDPDSRETFLAFAEHWRRMQDGGKTIPIVPVKPVGGGQYKKVLDEIIVKVNKFVPVEDLDNPAIALGFLMLPSDIKDSIRMIGSELEHAGLDEVERLLITDDSLKLPRIFRYRIIDSAIINNEQYLKMEIHNSFGMDEEFLKSQGPRKVNSSKFGDSPGYSTLKEWNSYIKDPYCYNNIQAKDFVPRPRYIDPDQIMVPMEYNRHVKYIDFQVDIPNVAYQNVDTSGLENRLKGQRIEVIKDYESMVREMASIDPGSSDHSEVNLNILNNISGEYAVAKESSVRYSGIYNTFVERATFDAEGALEYADILEVDDEGGKAKGKVELDSDPKWTNLLTYNLSNFKLGIDSIRHEDMFGPKGAKDYFMKKQYRIIKDPVPQGGSALGSSFPILYGEINKFPLTHAVSSSVTMEASSPMSSGNDIYILSSNECNISDDSDITLYLEDEDGMVGDSEFGFSSVIPHIVKSPFPNVVDNHSFIVDGVSRTGQLSTPYHKVKKFTTLQGIPLYGIQLRGGEWNSKIGFADKRYPIRNGVGTTRILASVSGAFRRDSMQTISHPCDIFIQFVKDNCESPYNETSIDLDSFQKVKSLTRWYTASIPLSEETLPFELMDRICQQFGYFWSIVKGKVHLSVGDIDDVDNSKFISENGDIVGYIEEVDEGYKNTFSEILYSYDRDWSGNIYRREIFLNSSNNQYCASASAAKGGKGRLEIKADYVYSQNVAIDVSNRIAKVLCRRRKIYNVSVRKKDIRYSPGDVVNITYSRLGLRYSPVLIMSVKESGSLYEMTFIKFF